MRSKKQVLFQSIVSLLVCVSMLLGTTFAWFTDSVTSANNIIVSGKLDVELDYLDENNEWQPVTEDIALLDQEAVWEPGHTEVVYLRIKNAGNLALSYLLGVQVLDEVGSVNMAGKDFELSDFIKFGVVESDVQSTYATREDARKAVSEPKGIKETYIEGTELYPADSGRTSEQYATLVVYMPEDVGNGANHASDANIPQIALGVSLVATQTEYESDSFGDDYDAAATDVMPAFSFPEVKLSEEVSKRVNTDENNKTTKELTLRNRKASAQVPAGVLVADDTNEITLTIEDMDSSSADVTLEDNEEKRSLDVHIEGVSEENTVPMTITIKEAAAVGLNEGNLKLYHVEGDETKPMVLIPFDAEFTAHNQFKYDPATGDIILYMATFSEVALVADTENAWNGAVATAFAGGDGTEGNPYLIANADQLAYLNECISNENDNYGDKHYKLIADINLGGEENANKGIIFYPIGYHKVGGSVATVALDDAPVAIYETTENPGSAVADGGQDWYTYGGAIKGTFDGAGHKVSNIYQNTWQLKGNYDGNYWNAAMGLFGYVFGGTIKNLTVNNFTSDGEFTPTGVIAAYAAGNATFENIAITNCNPRVYNTGNGGIIGIAGRENEAIEKITLKNITVDNSNKISALWGSYDVACGGLVGMYRGNADASGNATGDAIHFENCHVSAKMDVYNDVCGNYQYYAYRYAGMMIGSVRHNTTKDGKTVPNMAGISAENCTVKYGDWNNYYYCEFEKNGHPSYAGPDDYKFSRVDKSAISFDENGKAVCPHEHSAVEDKRAVYLPFNQLFTGYGWGVNSIGAEGVKNYDGIDVEDGLYDESVEKFKGTVNELTNNTEIALGDIFGFVNNGIDVVSAAVTVAVTNLDKQNPVSAEIKYDRDNWENSKIKFFGTGEICLTIQDYYFCTPTTIKVDVINRQSVEKFDVVMNNGDFLHRVGNEGTVPLDKLFKAKDGATVGTVSVTVEAVNGSSASGTYSNNAIQFSGTGVVKVTITDNDYCTPTELILEVVDATNLTSATGTTEGGNFVLLCDVNTSNYVNYWNCTLYGNGFTYSLKGAPTAYNSKQGHGVIITKNATLDNLKIVGDVYNSYGAYTNQDYYNTAVDVVGDTTIQNCYIANCSAPVRARSSVTIKNSTLYGGTVANLVIMSGTATLENVTTANCDDGRAMVGMGIVIHSDATETAKLVLNGTLTQYNFIGESKVPTDTYAKNLHNAMFSDDCSQYQFGTSPNRYVNTGIISLTSTFNGEDITDNAKTGYVGKSLNVSSYDGYVYTQPNTSGSVNNNYDEYKPTVQGAVPPSYSFDYTNKNYVAKTEGSNDYCYEENGKVNISMDEGDTFNWDTSILTIGKGITDYTVSMGGTDYTGKSIAFNKAGDYTVTYTYTDGNNSKFDENGNITTYSVTYTKTVNITVAVVKQTTKHAEFTFGSSNTASTTVTVGNNTYVMPNVSGTSSTIGSTTVDGKTIYYPIVEIIMSDGKTSHSSGWYAYFPVFSGAVTITDYANNGTGDKMTPYNGSTTTMPSGLSIVGDPTQLFKYQSSSAAGSTPVVKSNKLVYSSAKIEAKRSEYNTVVQYSYTDNAGATYYYYIGYHAPAQSYTSCVTSDTLVTLADGTQKRIDEVTYTDELVVWDFDKGAYAVANPSIIENHGYSMNDIIKLTFEDGTVVKVVNVHGFFDADLNKWVDINARNAADFVGHSFVQVDGNGYKTIKLASVDVITENVEAWSVLTDDYYNCVLENMFTITPPATEQLAFFAIGEDMKYDAEAKQADIEKYGLYTYDEMSHLMTREQFEAFNFAEIKIAVGKGMITFEELCALLDSYA